MFRFKINKPISVFGSTPHFPHSSGLMNPSAQDPTAGRLAAGLLTTFFALFGWFTLWQGGVALKGKSGATSFVDGHAGILVAGFAFIVATMGLALLLRSFEANRPAYYIGGVMMLLPPLLFVLFHSWSW